MWRSEVIALVAGLKIRESIGQGEVRIRDCPVTGYLVVDWVTPGKKAV